MISVCAVMGSVLRLVRRGGGGGGGAVRAGAVQVRGRGRGDDFGVCVHGFGPPSGAPWGGRRVSGGPGFYAGSGVVGQGFCLCFVPRLVGAGREAGWRSRAAPPPRLVSGSAAQRQRTSPLSTDAPIAAPAAAPSSVPSVFDPPSLMALPNSPPAIPPTISPVVPSDRRQ